MLRNLYCKALRRTGLQTHTQTYSYLHIIDYRRKQGLGLPGWVAGALQYVELRYSNYLFVFAVTTLNTDTDTDTVM